MAIVKQQTRTPVEYILPTPEEYLDRVQRIILRGLDNQEEEIKFFLPNLMSRAYTIVNEGEAIQFSNIPTDYLANDDIKGEGY